MVQDVEVAPEVCKACQSPGGVRGLRQIGRGYQDQPDGDGIGSRDAVVRRARAELPSIPDSPGGTGAPQER